MESYYNDDPQIRGLAYAGIREAIRSFFITMHKLSGEYLSSLGIDKRALKGQGKYAKQLVRQNIRHELEQTMKKYISDSKVYDEAIAIDKFMYYTATRITATIQINFRNFRYSLDKNVWMIEVLDKGERGGKKWDKYLIGYALEDLKRYCSKRFNIPIEDLETELPKLTNSLFPSFQDSKGNKIERMYNLITKANREGLKDAGLTYDEFPPNHIFRHTFAQDFLRASNWNYELCASLGGWVNTMILKKHYGEMGIDPKLDGLREAMGIEIKKEKRELRW